MEIFNNLINLNNYLLVSDSVHDRIMYETLFKNSKVQMMELC
jgi:hypothetical protein